MKYLYNDKEKLRYGNMIAFLVFCVYIVIHAINTSVTYMINNEFVHGFVVWSIVEIFLLCIWYPDEIRQKNALIKGEVIEGRIISIPYKKRERFILSKDRNGYNIVVGFEKNGVKKNVEFGEYSINPIDYVTLNDRCNLYVYKNRFYLKKFKSHKRVKNTTSTVSNSTEYHFPNKKEREYMINHIKYPIEIIKELDSDRTFEAIKERQNLSMIKSKNCLYISTNYFRTVKPYRKLFAEVRIDSKKEYDEYSFSLGVSIQRFMNENPISEEYNEEFFVSDVKEVIRKQISSKDKRIVIKDIIIVLKNR